VAGACACSNAHGGDVGTSENAAPHPSTPLSSTHMGAPVRDDSLCQVPRNSSDFDQYSARYHPAFEMFRLKVLATEHRRPVLVTSFNCSHRVTALAIDDAQDTWG
jgi:hypothetical protein